MSKTHPTMQRLYKITGKIPTEIASDLNITPQTVSNWSIRGISKTGAIEASKVYSLNIDWLLNGDISEDSSTQGAEVSGDNQSHWLSNQTLTSTSSSSIIDLMENLKSLERENQLTPELVILLNTTINTFRNLAYKKPTQL